MNIITVKVTNNSKSFVNYQQKIMERLKSKNGEIVKFGKMLYFFSPSSNISEGKNYIYARSA
jgi:hypothetical protein